MYVFIHLLQMITVELLGEAEEEGPGEPLLRPKERADVTPRIAKHNEACVLHLEILALDLVERRAEEPGGKEALYGVLLQGIR
jgi:hypothetical protein